MNAVRLMLKTLLLAQLLVAGCVSSMNIKRAAPVDLPLLINTANECYYIEDFLPVPNNILSGQSGKYAVRKYFYKNANYKDKLETDMMLSFYSKDGRCWSLYEEYAIEHE